MTRQVRKSSSCFLFRFHVNDSGVVQLWALNSEKDSPDAVLKEKDLVRIGHMYQIRRTDNIRYLSVQFATTRGVYKFVRMHAFMYVCMLACVHVSDCVHECIYIVCIYIYMYIYIYICIHIHILIHLNTHVWQH
jgi:hypothetical protein